jgi:hypothetical protein
MKIGIMLPQVKSVIRPADIIEMAQEAEWLDFASLWVGERLFGGGTLASLERAARLSYGLNPVLRSWEQAEMLAHEFPEQVRSSGTIQK